MTKVIFGNHSAVGVPQEEKDRIRRFYRDVLGCTITREGNQKDDFRMGDSFYITFLYENDGVALDEGSFLKEIYLELKADNVEEIRQKIIAFGVKVLEVPDQHLYFQAQEGYRTSRRAQIGSRLAQAAPAHQGAVAARRRWSWCRGQEGTPGTAGISEPGWPGHGCGGAEPRLPGRVPGRPPS